MLLLTRVERKALREKLAFTTSPHERVNSRKILIFVLLSAHSGSGRLHAQVPDWRQEIFLLCSNKE